MRVIGGTAKGRRLYTSSGRNTRPTTDRVREAIFNVLQNKLEHSYVLDTFAGSGALGIEALSRGAAKVVFIDKDKKAVAAIKRNLMDTGFAEKAKVLLADSIKSLPHLDEGFNLIFLDPPYNQGFIALAEPLLLQENFLADDAIIVLETSTKEPEIFNQTNWELIKESRYGDTCILYYQRRI